MSCPVRSIKPTVAVCYDYRKGTLLAGSGNWSEQNIAFGKLPHGRELGGDREFFLGLFVRGHASVENAIHGWIRNILDGNIREG